MRTAIRKHWLDFVAILGLILIAGAVSVYILGKQRLTLPAWVPVVGKDFFVVKAELVDRPGGHAGPGPDRQHRRRPGRRDLQGRAQGRQGRASTLRMQPKYGRVYKDAHVLMRPKTGLKDMVAELEPGTPGAGRLEDGDVIPVANTLPDVNLDEILASLDADTRDYLTILRRRRRRGPARQRARAGAGDPALRAVRALRPQGVRRARRAQAATSSA